jgi:hypothetical protein
VEGEQTPNKVEAEGGDHEDVTDQSSSPKNSSEE